MKKNLTFFIVLSLFMALPALSQAEEKTFVQGKDWRHYMSQREKFMSLIPPALLFSEYDVHLKLSLPQYIQLIDRVVKLNPQLENEEVSSIFASTVYLFEPQNRPALKTMEMNFLRGNLGTKPYHTPQLSFQDILSEISE